MAHYVKLCIYTNTSIQACVQVIHITLMHDFVFSIMQWLDVKILFTSIVVIIVQIQCK